MRTSSTLRCGLLAAGLSLGGLTVAADVPSEPPAAPSPCPKCESAATAPQPAPPEAFQGLAWGASETQLAQRFGTALQNAECSAAQRKALRPREACKHPQVPRYDVAGVPFRLNLLVDDPQRQLVRVQLAWAGDAPADTESGFSEKHRLLRQLLTQRYGSPEATHVANEPEAWTATARWRRGETLIELASTFQPRRGSTPAREQVEINYQPVTSGEAGKL